MELFKLPTDNFYIFLLFCGLALIIYFCNLFFKKHTEITNILDTLDQEILKQEFKINDEEKKKNIIIKEIELRTFAFVNKHGINPFALEKNGIDKKMSEYISKGDNTEAFIADYLKIESLKNSQHSNQFGLDFTNSTLKSNQGKVAAKISDLTFIRVVSSVAISAGVFLIIIGLFFWYSKNQSYQDKMLKLNFEKALKEDSSKVQTPIMKK